MSLTLTVSNREIERQADLAFKLREYKIFLAVNPGGLLTADSLATDWLEAELNAVDCPGYAANLGSFGAGVWNPINQRIEFPQVQAVFQARNGAWSYDTVCLWLFGEDYLHSINVENPARELTDQQVSAYSYNLQNYVDY